MGTQKVRIDFGGDADRPTLSHMRHTVYAAELGQHPINREERLEDRCDAFNRYIVARQGGEIVGFISITPPGHGGYSLDKYLTRAEMPFPVEMPCTG